MSDRSFFFVHTLALCVNYIINDCTEWQKYHNHVNYVATYFNQHEKAAQLVIQKQLDRGVSNDSIQKLIITYLLGGIHVSAPWSCTFSSPHAIAKVAEDLRIYITQLPHLSEEEENTLAEFLMVLADVRRVARLFEADRKVLLSRSPSCFQ